MPEALFDRLNDTNYADWRIKMEALLEEKELWDVVSGDETMPATGPNSKLAKAFRRKQRLAHAKIILNVESSQLPHTRYDDPKEMWENLARIHRSRGFGTLLSMRRRFFFMTKGDSQSMQAWIAAVRHAAFELEAADFEIRDIDLIIALTQGLPESYSSFIVSLDATPPDELSIDTLIVRLLNEESRQRGTTTIKKSDPESENAAFASYPRTRTAGRGPGQQVEKGDNEKMKEFRCYNCRGIGHMARDCPSPKQDDTTAYADDDDDAAW
jgi:hypothetical protein